MDADDVAGGEKADEIGCALDIGGKIAIDEIWIAGEHALEDIARDVRHPLADATEADDAQRHLTGALELSGRQVMPLTRANVAMVGDDVPDERQHQRQGVRSDFADAVIRRVGHPYAVARARCGVDGIETRADTADDPELR